MKLCSKCGNGNPDESVFCASCGTPLQQAPTAPDQPVAAEPPVQEGSYTTQPGTYYTDPGQPQTDYQAAPVAVKPSNPNILWLILNIALTVLCCCSIIGPILGIVGIVFSAMGMGSYNKGDYEDSKKKSHLAMIMFIIGAVLGIITFIILMITGALANWTSDYGYSFN